MQGGHTELFKTWVEVRSNGICTWESPANLPESRCDVDIDSFPFDRQICSLLFGSATYGSELLNIQSMQVKMEEMPETGIYKTQVCGDLNFLVHVHPLTLQPLNACYRVGHVAAKK